MSVSFNKDHQSCSEKIQFQNSQLNPSHNDSARNHSVPMQKYPSISRKTSKRRQIQEEKASFLEIFKELLTIVNQNFSKVSQNTSFKNKQYRVPKMSKNSSKMKKQESMVHKQSQKKQEEKPVQKQQKKVVIQMIEEKCQKMRQNLQKQTAKKGVFQNYSVLMSYTIHEQEQDENQIIQQQLQNKFKTFQVQGVENNQQNSNGKHPSSLNQFSMSNQEQHMQDEQEEKSQSIQQNQFLQGYRLDVSDMKQKNQVEKIVERGKIVAEEEQHKKN